MTGFRISKYLVLDDNEVVRDAETLERLGIIVFAEGRRERLLAGLEATYGMDEDGMLVTTPEDDERVASVLEAVGLRMEDLIAAEAASALLEPDLSGPLSGRCKPSRVKTQLIDCEDEAFTLLHTQISQLELENTFLRAELTVRDLNGEIDQLERRLADLKGCSNAMGDPQRSVAKSMQEPLVYRGPASEGKRQVRKRLKRN